MFLFKSRDDARSNSPPSVAINLRGCEVTPEVNLTQGKFHIKLEVPPENGVGANSEVWVRCDNVRLTNSVHIRNPQLTRPFPNIYRKINTLNGWLHAGWHRKVDR